VEIGIVGLANVGKSTLFNALTGAHAACSNYPFTTIEPNVGVVTVPDPRLERLAEIFKPEKVTPATVRFVDIAGLVKGASQGEGLGNRFLAHIREVDAVLNVVRLFHDPVVVNPMGSPDPRRDVEIIETELILADLASIERQGRVRTGDKAAQDLFELMEKVREGLAAGRPARALGFSAASLKAFNLLTAKPEMYVGNTDEKPDPAQVAALEAVARERGAACVSLCAKLEAEIAELPPEDRRAFMEELGLQQTGLERILFAAYKLLDLISFFTTVGTREVRAWTALRGVKAAQAAGLVHSDFEKGFIRAEVYRFEDLDRLGSEHAVQEKGLIRSEGKDYAVEEGDICFFKFHV